jgi:AraC-like DNA-binding protein
LTLTPVPRHPTQLLARRQVYVDQEALIEIREASHGVAGLTRTTQPCKSIRQSAFNDRACHSRMERRGVMGRRIEFHRISSSFVDRRPYKSPLLARDVARSAMVQTGLISRQGYMPGIVRVIAISPNNVCEPPMPVREIHPDNLLHPDLGLAEVEDYRAAAVCYSGTVKKDTRYGRHHHRRAQLFHIVCGAVTIETERGAFVVPPERAVWIPSDVVHAVTYLDDTAQRFVFFRPETVRHLPAQPAVIRLSPLLRELILALMGYSRDGAATGPGRRIVGVIIDQLATERAAPLHLPMPSSERLRRAMRELACDPARSDSLSDVARKAAMSDRSFERHFFIETGLSFRAWRQQARLMKAVEWLSLGIPVGEIADRLGYEQPSAFVAGFRRAFGVTPGRYFDSDG